MRLEDSKCQVYLEIRTDVRVFRGTPVTTTVACSILRTRGPVDFVVSYLLRTSQDAQSRDCFATGHATAHAFAAREGVEEYGSTMVRMGSIQCMLLWSPFDAYQTRTDALRGRFTRRDTIGVPTAQASSLEPHYSTFPQSQKQAVTYEPKSYYAQDM
ncbi:hypothetical protein PLICRDRAFT_50531 [Plicaturopsis crispa FD-325 SS-3]|nr:hypothetical protein PLICRDRAFT_50531 [Plicaturopsis crispa FD-325 SS-3]